MVLFGTDFSENDVNFARSNDMGLEILKYSNPAFVDDFEKNRVQIADTIAGMPALSMHGAFHDVYHTSVDPLIREVAKKRFLQSLEVAAFHGIGRVIFHSSYRRLLDGRSAQAVDIFLQRAIEFWKDFVTHIPDGMTVYIENIEDDDPEVFVQIFRGVNSPKIRCCLDIGHAYFSHAVSLNRWIDVLRDYIGHVHIHDNQGQSDQHLPLGQGAIPLTGAINKIFYCVGEDVPFVLECEMEESVRWLRHTGFGV